MAQVKLVYKVKSLHEPPV